MKTFHDFYDRLTWMYILELNYWRGPNDAWTLDQNIGGAAPQDRRPVSIVYQISLMSKIFGSTTTCQPSLRGVHARCTKLVYGSVR